MEKPQKKIKIDLTMNNDNMNEDNVEQNNVNNDQHC